MNSVDASVAWLLSKKVPRSEYPIEGCDLGSLGTNGKMVSSGMSSSDRRAMASDITRSVAEMTTGITSAILQSRQARAQPSAQVESGSDLIGGEAYGVQARSPWGTIAIGGTAVVIIGGLLAYIAATKKK